MVTRRRILGLTALIALALSVTPAGQARIQRGWQTVRTTLLFTPDDTQDLGESGANRPRIGYFGTAVAIGDNPAAGGLVRLANNDGIRWRNAANTANFSGLSVNSSNELNVGDASTTTQMFGLVASFIGATSTTGIRLQMSGTPTVSSGFATGNYIATGSTDSAGGVFVGTNSSSSGVIQFASAWGRAPFGCVASIATQTASQVQALGCVTSTTTLTLTSPALAASRTVYWQVFGALP